MQIKQGWNLISTRGKITSKSKGYVREKGQAEIIGGVVGKWTGGIGSKPCGSWNIAEIGQLGMNKKIENCTNWKLEGKSKEGGLKQAQNINLLAEEMWQEK